MTEPFFSTPNKLDFVSLAGLDEGSQGIPVREGQCAAGETAKLPVCLLFVCGQTEAWSVVSTRYPLLSP